MEQFGFEFDLTPERIIYSVAELNGAIRAVIDQEFHDVWVTGEISGLKLATSGHYYFTLKEREAQVRCVAFRSAHRYWKFKPQDGLAVLRSRRVNENHNRVFLAGGRRDQRASQPHVAIREVDILVFLDLDALGATASSVLTLPRQRRDSARGVALEFNSGLD